MEAEVVVCVYENASLSLWPTFLTVAQNSKRAATGPVLHQHSSCYRLEVIQINNLEGL